MPTDGSQSAAHSPWNLWLGRFFLQRQYRPQGVIQGNSAHAVEDNPAETVTGLTLGAMVPWRNRRLRTGSSPYRSRRAVLSVASAAVTAGSDQGGERHAVDPAQLHRHTTLVAGLADPLFAWIGLAASVRNYSALR